MDLGGITVKWGNSKMTIFGKNHNYLFTVPRIDKLYILKGYVEKVVLFTVPRIDKLYILKGYVEKVVQTKELAFSTGLDRKLVHRRFCHLNITMLNHMSQNNVANGLDNLCGKFDACNTCKITKSTRTNFKVNHGIMTKTVLEKVHMDVWGKSPVNSVGGAEYFVHAKSPDLKLKPSKITEWTRVERPRNKSSRIDVYYYPPGDKTRLRSNNQAKEYCDKNQIDDTDSESEDSPSNSVVDNQISDIFESEVYNEEIPKNFSDAQKLPERNRWNKAMEKELNIMNEKKVWEIVDKPPNAKVIGNRWVYAVKRDENNNVKQYKARLVAQGFRQQHGIDFLDVFSPVVNSSVIRLLFIILVSMLCWKYAQLDVKAAYLYVNFSEVIFMKQPPGFEIVDETNKYTLMT
nr:uncharacterized protein LOC122271756 [Parasteatoda tepidariorum]